MDRTIFIADDELDFVSTLRSRLEFEGYRIETAPDGTTKGLPGVLACDTDTPTCATREGAPIEPALAARPTRPKQAHRRASRMPAPSAPDGPPKRTSPSSCLTRAKR